MPTVGAHARRTVGTDRIAAVANSNFTLSNLKLLRNGADVDWLFSIDNATLIGGAVICTATLWIAGRFTVKAGLDSIQTPHPRLQP